MPGPIFKEIRYLFFYITHSLTHTHMRTHTHTQCEITDLKKKNEILEEQGSPTTPHFLHLLPSFTPFLCFPLSLYSTVGVMEKLPLPLSVHHLNGVQRSPFERRSAFTVHGSNVHCFLAIRPASRSVSKRRAI